MKSVGVALAALLALAAPAWADDLGRVEAVCFTPGGDCTSLIVHEIEGARREIRVQAYSFTSPPIAKALADAKRRGIDVRAILDRTIAAPNTAAPPIWCTPESRSGSMTGSGSRTTR